MTLVQGYLTQTLEGYTCMISPANFVGHPAKDDCMIFMLAIGRSAYGLAYG